MVHKLNFIFLDGYNADSFFFASLVPFNILMQAMSHIIFKLKKKEIINDDLVRHEFKKAMRDAYMFRLTFWCFNRCLQWAIYALN